MTAPGLDSTTAVVLADVALIIGAAHLFGRLARRLRQPPVVGEIVAGLALGPSLLGLLPGNPTDVLFPAYVRPFLHVLAQFGLVLFMFGIGYRLEASHVRGSGRQITLVSLSSVALPFALGAGLAYLLYPWYDHGFLHSTGPLGPAVFLGAAMSITAFPVLARIINDRGMHRERLGGIALTCASLQDALAWCLLAAAVAVVTADRPQSLLVLAAEAAAFVLVLRYAVRPLLERLLSSTDRWSGGAAAAYPVLMIGLLLSAWCTSVIGLHAVLGAFAFGAVVPRGRLEAIAPQVPERIDQTGSLLLPVFFTLTGLSVDFSGLGVRGAVALAAIIVVACAGKFAGATLSARLTGFDRGDALRLGVLLNARGLTELIILNVGLSLHVIDRRMFTAMVVMALVTTVMTGPLLDAVQKRHPAAVPLPPKAPPVPTGASASATAAHS
ncbi:cation:proton antiporter [Kitasatospora sp. NBC_01539]|uniref:cation:proton antiporter n=1 Tax=Kitasatospora sp. NBC_01539 TaxID=2903577 RepID=UPI0038602574